MRRPALSVAQAVESRDSDKVIADGETVPTGVGDLDDRTAERTALVLLGKTDERAGRRDRAAVDVDHETNERPIERLALGVRAGDDPDLECVENHAGSDRVDPDQIHEALHQQRVVAPPRVLEHLPQHLIGLDRHRLVRPAGGSGVEPVGHGDDLGEDVELARTDRLGIAGEIGLHVVFVGDEDRAKRHLVVSLEMEERQGAEPRVALHDPPFGVVEAGRLVQNGERHARLSDVVQQGRHPEIVQLKPGESQLLAERDGEDAHVHRVGERVFVVVANRRETDERGLIVEDLVHDELHRALDPLHAARASEPHPGHHVLRDGHALRVHPLGRLTLLLGLGLLVSGALDGDAVDVPRVQALIELIEPRIRLGPLREAEQEAQKNLPLAPVDAGRDPQGPDIERAQDREDVTERGVVVELESEAGGVDENEVAREADLELRFDREERRGPRRRDRPAPSAPWRSRPDTA